MKIVALLKVLLSASVLSFMMAGAAHAADQANAAEAEALVKKAVAYIKANGPEKSYEEFVNGKSFKDRELYITVMDLTGKVLAHGANPKLIGKDLSALTDSDGKPTTKLMLDVAKSKGKGWTGDYKFMNPVTHKIATKAMYVERVGETDTLVAVGVYKSQ